MAKLTQNQEAVNAQLVKGRTISQYGTGDARGYDSYYRWDDTLEVVPSKTISSMRRKGIEIIAPIAKGVIVKYDPYNSPVKIAHVKVEKVTKDEYSDEALERARKGIFG